MIIGLLIVNPSQTASHILSSQTLSVYNAFPDQSFTRPVDIQSPDDGTDRLFIVEQAGRIIVFDNDFNSTQSDIFLDIVSQVEDIGNEEGLLGLAFHPNYATNGYFFVYYSAESSNSIVSRFSVDNANENFANVSSELILLNINQPYPNHNGGSLAFGPDGMLYISLGDGGSFADPQGNGQNRQTLLGSILRIDVDNVDEGLNYSIPIDNPFYNNGNDYQEEIFAYGLRNPWRMSFDTDTGDLWVGDVGQGKYEEVDIVVSGGNYGWNIQEGFSCFSPSSGCDKAGLIQPVFDYDHSFGLSITGGYVYHGPSVFELRDAYIFADYQSGIIWKITDPYGDQITELILDTSLLIASFGTDNDGELYIAAFDGSIYKFTSSLAVITITEISTNEVTNTQTITTVENGTTIIITTESVSTSLQTITTERTVVETGTGTNNFTGILSVTGFLFMTTYLIRRVRAKSY